MDCLSTSVPLILVLTTLYTPSFSHPLSTIPEQVARRFVPVPPSTYVSAAKLSTKAILLIVILILVTLILSTCTCYICIKRRRSRARARRLAKQSAESRQLKPRINKRNARFFAPGLVMDKIERERLREERETEKAWAGKEEEYEMWKFGAVGGVHVEEVKRPEKAKGGWKEVLRGVVVRN
ncbi:hypothetical protein EG329_001909 [Mollisiaceae sp. DMI_Dod_QoI]|nr:hypothetical protein EG329_001909 [Helotiales sp. DMI_Dod_QoI]